MILFVDVEDANAMKRAAGTDLPALIEAAGHTCLVDSIANLTQPQWQTIDKIVAQRQINYLQYATVARLAVTEQSELHMLDKWFAHRKLGELGLNYLNTQIVMSHEDIENFADEHVVIKPVMSMQSIASLDFAYIPMPKSELLAKLDTEQITLNPGEYIVQEAVTNTRPIIFVTGYVNPQGQIHIDGALKEWFSINDGFFEDKLRYPNRHVFLIEEVPLEEMDEFYLEAIRQIKVVLEHFGSTSTPFCIQAIVDDDNEVQLLDFNFGFGKGYALHIRQRTPQYVIDRIRYTYGGADSIPPNTTYALNVIFDTPNGFTDELKEYFSTRPMYFGIGQPDRDYVFENVNAPTTYVYHRYKSGCMILGSSREEAYQVREEFLAFLAAAN